MTYLYGDSTDSGLELNYIELLRDFLDVAVQIMLSEHRIKSAREAATQKKLEAGAELERLRVLGESVEAALNEARSSQSNSATDQSIVALHKTANSTLKRAAESVKESVAQLEQQLVSRQQKERAANTKILEPLLLHHTLPDSQNSVDLKANGSGSYDATINGSSKQGLAWKFRAEVPSDSPFHEALRVSARTPDFTIQIPEKSGFVRKSMKLKAQRLSSYYITELRHSLGQVHVKLRGSAHGDDTGYDLKLSPTAPRVVLTRVHKGEISPPFEPLEADAQSLASFCRELSRDAEALEEHRTTLLELKFDNSRVHDYADPSRIVDRLVKRIGPVIQEIARHSLADTELVLKRVLANDRREEIFASKADLRDTLATVPSDFRQIFSPLGLGDLGGYENDFDQTNQLDTLAPVAQHIVVDEPTEPAADEPTPQEITAIPVDEIGHIEDSIDVTITEAAPPNRSVPLPGMTEAPAPEPDSVDQALSRLEVED